MADRSDARREFDHLVNRARKAGILKFCHDGVAVLAVDQAPASAVMLPVEPSHGPPPEAPKDGAADPSEDPTATEPE